MDETAIQAIGHMAVAAAQENRINQGGEGIPAIILESGQNLHAYENLLPTRFRFRGKFDTTAVQDFIDYVTRNDPAAQGFVDPDAMMARVFLNLGTTDKPGHADWVATLKLKPTAAYAALRAIEAKPLQQRDLVAWCEDWAANLSAIVGETTVTIAQALVAIRDITLTAKAASTHKDRDFGASKTAVEEIEASGASGMPTHLVFKTAPYSMFGEREFKLRVSVVTGDKPYLALRTVGKEAIEESIAKEFAATIADKLGDATITLGTFVP